MMAIEHDGVMRRLPPEKARGYRAVAFHPQWQGILEPLITHQHLADLEVGEVREADHAEIHRDGDAQRRAIQRVLAGDQAQALRARRRNQAIGQPTINGFFLGPKD